MQITLTASLQTVCDMCVPYSHKLNRFYSEKLISICDNWQVYCDTREDWKSMNSVETYDIIWNISEKF